MAGRFGRVSDVMTHPDKTAWATEVSTFLSALANPQRLMIVCALGQRERLVADLKAELGIQQPTLSQQLGILRAAGLVRARREASHVFYTLMDAKAAQLVDTLHDLFSTDKEMP